MTDLYGLFSLLGVRSQMWKKKRKHPKNPDALAPYRQCCGSGMFIPDPGSRILIFTHPGSRIQKQVEKRGVKNFFLSNIFL
jgi:hypothetical protein